MCSCLKPIKILNITSVSKKISKCNNLKLILAHFYNEAKIRFVLICYIVSGRTSDSSCKWYFVVKIVLTYCEKKCSSYGQKTFKIRGWRPRICKRFEITRTIYSNSARSKQFLVTECFFNLFLEVSHFSINSNNIGI